MEHKYKILGITSLLLLIGTTYAVASSFSYQEEYADIVVWNPKLVSDPTPIDIPLDIPPPPPEETVEDNTSEEEVVEEQENSVEESEAVVPPQVEEKQDEKKEIKEELPPQEEFKEDEIEEKVEEVQEPEPEKEPEAEPLPPEEPKQQEEAKPVEPKVKEEIKEPITEDVEELPKTEATKENKEVKSERIKESEVKKEDAPLTETQPKVVEPIEEPRPSPTPTDKPVNTPPKPQKEEKSKADKNKAKGAQQKNKKEKRVKDPGWIAPKEPIPLSKNPNNTNEFGVSTFGTDWQHDLQDTTRLDWWNKNVNKLVSVEKPDRDIKTKEFRDLYDEYKKSNNLDPRPLRKQCKKFYYSKNKQGPDQSIREDTWHYCRYNG